MTTLPEVRKPVTPVRLSAARITIYALRLLWIAVRILAVLVLIRESGAFFYQGF